MLVDAFTLAILTTLGFLMVYKKLPRRIRRFLESKSLFTDVVALLLTYTFLGGTLTALVAGAMVGIFTSMLLYVVNNPDEFLYLYDIWDMMKMELKNFKEELGRIGKQYKEERDQRVVDILKPTTT